MNTRQILRFLTLRGLALAGVLALSSISSSAWAQSMREVLGPGDTVRVSAYRYPDLTTEARLSEKGSISVPLIGEVKLAGMTPEQAAGLIAERLKRGNFILNPQINVAVLTARSREVSVLGFVKNPGRYALDGASAKLSEVIAMAGGRLPDGADEVTVQSHRGGRTLAMSTNLRLVMEGDASQNLDVHSGDSVFVPRAPMFYIYGEVNHGGAFPMVPDLTVMQAISLAGGLTQRGSNNRVQLRRRGADGKWKLSRARLSDPVTPNDVIFVRESLF